MIITEETANTQTDRHLVPSIHVDGHHSRGTILLILLVFLTSFSDHQAINLQTSTGSQFGIGGTSIAVDSERQTVDPRARNSKHPGALVVAITKVDEDMFVGNNFVGAEGAEASETLIGVKSDRHSDVAGWRQRCKLKEG